MTKKDMIKTIQEREAEAWVNLKHWKKVLGADHKQTELYRWAWSEIYNVMQELGIEKNRRSIRWNMES